MHAPPIIRPGRPEDAGPVSRLLVQTWHATYDRLMGADRVADITARWHEPGVIARQVGNPSLVFLVAEADGAIVGHALAGPDPQRPDAAVLQRLYVLPAWQGRGVGTALFEAALARLPGRAFTLEVEAGNDPAIAFYRRHGFNTVRATNACGGETDIPTLVMERPASGNA